MRILIYPTYEFLGHIQADSSYILTRAMAEQLGKKKDFFAYWLVPEQAPTKKYTPGYLEIREKLSGSRDLNEITQYKSIDLFNPTDGKYPLDAVISNNAGKAYEFMNYYSLLNLQRDNVNVYTWDFSTKFKGDCEISNIDERNLATHAMAYAFAKRNFFFSKFSRKKAREDVMKFCSSYMVNEFDKHSELIPIAFDSKELDESLAEKDSKFSFYFGGRFTATKGGEEILSHYDYLYSFGRDIKIKVTTPNGGSRRLSKFLSKRGQEIEVHEKLSQKDAWKVMSSCHVSIYHQSLKMYPAAPMEQLYAGLIVLFKDYGYESEILPPGYPYLFKTDEEAATLVRYVFNNYEEAKKRIEYVKAWLEENVDRRKGIDKIAEFMRQDQEKVYKPREIGKNLFFTGQGVSFQYLKRKIEDQARHKQLIWASMKKGRLTGIMNAELYKKNIPLDYRDNCELELPYYEKIEKL